MKVLYILSGFNLFGGTPKKTLDLIKESENDCYLYVWTNGHIENKEKFIAAGAKITMGFYGWNLIKHLLLLIKLVDEEKIQIVQSQFSFGEVLGGLLKMFRPKLKLIIAFVGPFSPKGLKRRIVNYVYKKVDAFVFISEYVKFEKQIVFSSLKEKENRIIYNGTERRLIGESYDEKLKGRSLLDIAGLVDWKNADVLLKAMKIILNDSSYSDIHLYIIGDGLYRAELEEKIRKLNIDENVHLLGYRDNVGSYLAQCSVFVHPAYAEGFGIVIPEAMMERKPIIVADAGALPELIENNYSGLVIDAFDEKAWAMSITKLLNNEDLREKLSKNAKKVALEKFSINEYVQNYTNLYKFLINEN